MINNQLCDNFSFYGGETILLSTKSIKKVKPNFSDDDTAFGRLMFSMIGLLVPMMKFLDSVNEDSGTLLVCNNLKLREEQQECECCCEVKFSGVENLVVTLLDVLYNFYGDIEKWTSSNQKNIAVVLRTNGQIRAFELVGGRRNQAIDEGKCLIEASENVDNNKEDTWGKICSDIVGNLYLDDSEATEIEEYFQKIMTSHEKLERDISEKYLMSDEICFYNKFKQEDICTAFPRRATIESYLEDYYEISKLCIKHYKLFTQSQYAQKIIERILNFGISGEKQGTVNLLKSPFALDALMHIYDRSVVFAEEINKADNYTEGIRAMLESDFVSSCILEFRRWIYSNGKSVLTTFEGQGNALRNYKSRDLSSIFMVRAIRLYEKIKEFLKKTGENEVSVCIVGYTRIVNNEAPEIEELKKMVESACGKENKVTYSVYLNGHRKFSPEIENVDICKKRYNDLFQRKRIEKIIGENDIIFFLDPPLMYYEEFYPKVGGSWNSAYMSFKNDSYTENNHRWGIKREIGTSGVLTEISKHLAAMSNPYSANSGFFEPFLKEYLLEHISKCVKSSGKKKTVYCYLSTIETREGVNYKRSKLSHVEKYNGKVFNILRFDNLDYASTGELRLYDGEMTNYFPDMIMKPICFSFWNILKNISIRLKETVFEVENAPYLLDNIAIELSWDKKMEKFKIRAGATKKISEVFEKKGLLFCEDGRELKDILKGIFEIVLGVRESMLQKSIRDDVANVLLGRAGDAIHYLNYYRLLKADLKVKSIECEIIGDENDEVIKDILDKNIIDGKSDKKLYIEMMRLFDFFTVDDMQRALLKNQILENKENPELIFRNIREACLQCGYTDCNLYYNMEG